MPVKIGDPAPDFQVKDDAGKMRILAEFRGKKVIMEFLAYLFFYVKELIGYGDCTIIEHRSGRVTMIDINNSQTLRLAQQRVGLERCSVPD